MAIVADLWTQIELALKWAVPILGTVFLVGAVGLPYQRVNKRMDDRAERTRTAAKAGLGSPPARRSKAGARFLLRPARGSQPRQGPARSKFSHNIDLGQYQLENAASDIAHDVKIDVFTNSGLKPKMVSSRTIMLSQLPHAFRRCFRLGRPAEPKSLLCASGGTIFTERISSNDFKLRTPRSSDGVEPQSRTMPIRGSRLPNNRYVRALAMPSHDRNPLPELRQQALTPPIHRAPPSRWGRRAAPCKAEVRRFIWPQSGGITAMQRTETIDRHLPLQREAARALGLLASGQKFEAIELDADGSARVTFTGLHLRDLDPAAVKTAAGIALAFEFANIRSRDREKEEAWLNTLLSALDDTGPKRADILATAGDLATAMAEGQAFLDLKQQAIHEVVGATVVRGGRATFARLSSGMGRKENGIDTRPDLVESARENLEAHSKVIKAVDKKVAEIGVAKETSAAQ